MGAFKHLRHLVHLDLSSNAIRDINLADLPQTLERCYLEDNELSGPLDLTKIHPNMKFLNLAMNRFSGTVNLRSLPQSLEIMSLGNNQLSGPVDLKSLPHRLCTLCLQ